MILIPCPHCGPRNSDEFRHCGEERRRPDPAATTPQQWREYLYERDNLAGWVRERWYHVLGCRRFFTLDRDTVSNTVRPVTVTTSRSAETERPAWQPGPA